MDNDRRRRLVEELQGRRLDEAYQIPSIRADLEQEAVSPSPDRLVTADQLAQLRELIAERDQATEALAPEAFFSTDQVVVVPGFMGSSLSDVSPNGLGLIWITPAIALFDRLSNLRLSSLGAGDTESDASPAVKIAATRALPVLYDLLTLDLEIRRYTTSVFPVDWRRDVEPTANRLAQRLKSLVPQGLPIHLIAHSQGALVARRALQVLRESGDNTTLDQIKNLVLLGPANYGTFSAAFALAGSHSFLETLRRLAVTPPTGFQPVLATMSGLYQLVPFDASRIPWLSNNPLGKTASWPAPVDAARLRRFFGWAENVDTTFFKSKTTVILGDNNGKPTPGGVKTANGLLVPDPEFGLSGDGTVPHSCSVLPGASTFLALNTEHMMLPTYRSVIGAVRDLLAGRTPSLKPVSSDPSNYLTPMLEREGVQIAEGVAEGVEAIPAPIAAAGAAIAQSALEPLLRSLASAANETQTRIRLSVVAEPARQ
jgi:pimeloyl-ACP methyl ester carboxylesterase